MGSNEGRDGWFFGRPAGQRVNLWSGSMDLSLLPFTWYPAGGEREASGGISTRSVSGEGGGAQGGGAAVAGPGFFKRKVSPPGGCCGPAEGSGIFDPSPPPGCQALGWMLL